MPSKKEQDKILKIEKINMLLGMFLHVYMRGEVKLLITTLYSQNYKDRVSTSIFSSACSISEST